MKIIKLLIATLFLFVFVFSAEAQIVVTSTTALQKKYRNLQKKNLCDKRVWE